MATPATESGFVSRGIDFGHALAAAKEGKLIARAGWNGKGMFVFMRPEDTLSVDMIVEKVKSLPQALKNHYQETASATDQVRFLAYFCMKAADGSIVNGWLASQTDMLATDWVILD